MASTLTSKSKDPRGAPVLVRVDPAIYLAARTKAEAAGGTITGVLRALLIAWAASPAEPLLPGLRTPEDKSPTL